MEIVSASSSSSSSQSVNIEENPYWHPFIIHVASTGFPGCPLYHPKHRILRVYIEDVVTNKVFNRYIKHQDINIGETIEWLTGINEDMLYKKEARDANSVLTDMLKWVHKQCHRVGATKCKKTPLMIGFSLGYTKSLILKSMPMDCGKEGCNLSWKWLDLHEAIKIKFPDMKYNSFLDNYADKPFKKKPYSIYAVLFHFFGQYSMDLRDFDMYAKWMRRLFIEHVAPVLWETLAHSSLDKCGGDDGIFIEDDESEWWKNTPGMLLPKNVTLPGHTPVMLTPLRHIRHIGKFACSIADVLNREYFVAERGMAAYVTNEHTITVAHLYVYGRYQLLNIASAGNVTLPYTDVWYQILMYVEGFLRYKIGIYTDEILLNILAPMTNRTPEELYNNTFIEGTSQPIFPTLPGHPVSYAPFEFSDVTAMNLYENLNIKTAHDLFIDYMLFKDGCSTQGNLYTKTTLKGWVFKILSAINMANNDKFTEAICEDKFKLIIPAYQKDDE